MSIRTAHAQTVPGALASPVAVVTGLGPLAGAAVADPPVKAGSGAAVVPASLAGRSTASSPRGSAMPATGSRGAGLRLAAVLLAVVAQAVLVAVVVLLLVLVQRGAAETTSTPTPTPQTAPVAP